MLVSVNEWRNLCVSYMLESGIPEADARLTTEIALYGDLRGVPTHGTSRLPIYRNRLQVGVTNKTPSPRILNTAPVFLEIDGDNALGQIATSFALEQCMERAKTYGMASAAVRRSNHVGMLAYYALKACERDLAAFITCHTIAFAPAPGGKQPVVGTNPHCWGFPCKEGPIVLDMAITVARGKIKDAFVAGKDIPPGWAVDKNGNDTTSAKEALEGLLLPIGGAKGYGLGVVSSMLAGVMADTPCCDDMIHPLDNLNVPANCGTFLTVFDPSKVTDLEGYYRRASAFHAYVKSRKTWEPGAAVFLPGEPEHLRQLAAETRGVDIDQTTYDIVTGKKAFRPVF